MGTTTITQTKITQQTTTLTKKGVSDPAHKQWMTKKNKQIENQQKKIEQQNNKIRDLKNQLRAVKNNNE